MPPRVVERFFEFSLLGMLAAGFFAVAGSGYLDWPTAALTLAGFCLRGLMAAGVMEIQLSGRTVAALTLGYIGFYPIDYYYISDTLLAATVHLLFFLAVMKVLTAKSNRDYTYVKVIATLELLAAALLSVSLSFFGYLALFLLFAIATLASGEVRRSTQLRRSVVRTGLKAFPRRLGVLAAVLFHGILLLTAGLFFVLPRTARAALERFVPERYHLSGFSNEVTLGQLGEIKRSSRAVLHARLFPDGGFMEVRWRGMALTHFDGRRWFNPPDEEELLRVEQGMVTLPRGPRTRAGRSLPYEVHLNEGASGTLFFAGVPDSINLGRDTFRVFRSRHGSFRMPGYATPGLSYFVYSFLEDEHAPVSFPPRPLPVAERDELIKTPDIDPRIAPLAREFARGAPTEVEKARAVEHHLRHDFGYTLQLLPAAVADPLAHFLFVRRKGHCEYFASAMAVMLRTMGIPTRVVTGFQSGVFNPITGWQVVRASDAHSWVEAWITGSGWMTFDPTPSDPSAAGINLGTRLALLFDTAEQFWQDWVLGYDLDRQIVLASRMEESGRKLRFRWLEGLGTKIKSALNSGASYAPMLAAIVAFAILLVMLGPGALRWYRGWLRERRLSRGQGSSSDATLLYLRMLNVLERRGVQKPPWLTPNEFARGGVRRAQPPEIAAVVEDLTAAYNEFRFGGRSEVAPRMVQLLDRLAKL
ncbi:MAG TPA: DUF3488 and transglutaminase-like domain-containing protein [Bryobacteraceae bacterium]|jgi:hypothetical protein|nr:DUF3488 and transglutaminase-like domain-containing protein [Bryobacteraceae bacterium]